MENASPWKSPTLDVKRHNNPHQHPMIHHPTQNMDANNNNNNNNNNSTTSEAFIWRTRSLDGGRLLFGTSNSDNHNQEDNDHEMEEQAHEEDSQKPRHAKAQQERRQQQQQQHALHSSFDASLLEEQKDVSRSSKRRASLSAATTTTTTCTPLNIHAATRTPVASWKHHGNHAYNMLSNNTSSHNINDSSISTTPHSSGRKHLRQPHKTPSGRGTLSHSHLFGASYYHGDKSHDEDEAGDVHHEHDCDDDDERICPGTVRKLARRNSNDSAKSKGTPVRPLCSTSRWNNSTASNNRNPPGSTWKAPRTTAASTLNTVTKFPLTPTTVPNSTATTQPPTTQQRLSIHHDTSPSGTPFRFTSFPASLPRVHPPMRDTNNATHHHQQQHAAAASSSLHPTANTNNGHYFYNGTAGDDPDSVRKRMYFGFPPLGGGGGGANQALTSASNHTNNNNATANNNNSNSTGNNQSREEDGTQNTSISSLSTHGEEDPRMPPVHTRLFLEEEQYAYSDDDDDEDEDDHDDDHGDDHHARTKKNLAEDVLGRTRLNFNLLMSPLNNNQHNHHKMTNKSHHSSDNHNNDDDDENDKPPPNEDNPLFQQPADESPFKDLGKATENDVLKMNLDEDDDTYPTDLLSRPYEHRHVHSFPSTMSSHTPLRNLSGCDDLTTTSNAGLPGSANLDDPSHPHNHDHHRTHHHQGPPPTPEEVQLHFQFDAGQCSPIPGIPDEEDLLRTRPPAAQRTSSGIKLSATSKSRLPPKPYPPAEAPALSSFKSSSNNNSTHSKDTLHQQQQQDDVRLSFSQESISSSASAKQRRLRPMPDMSAFEMDSGSKTGGHHHDRSTDDGSANNMSAPSPTLRCPPTPVRTPAWAHASAAGASDNDSCDGEGGGSGIRPAVFHRSNSLSTTRVLATCADPSYAATIKEPGAETVSCESTQQTGDGSMDHEMDLGQDDSNRNATRPQHPEAPPRIRRSVGEMGSIISFATDFESLGILGKGAFADVYKVRCKLDNRLYAVKRNRRHFRGKRDRDMALAEVRSMQRLQQQQDQPSSSTCLQYLLFFYRAWQEDGHFFCQTELCCRDTCRELMDSLSVEWYEARTRYPSLLRNLPAPEGVVSGSPFDVAGRNLPDMTVWKICHDICAGLSHMHRCGVGHFDVKPENIFFVANAELGGLCKLGDFGMSCEIGSSGDGQEGDQKYMPPELLSSGVKRTSSDIFSLGLTLYELSAPLGFELPKQGPRWHELRSGSHRPELPACRDPALRDLIQQMILPGQGKRPSANSILKTEKVLLAGTRCDVFLQDYIRDVEDYDRREEERIAAANYVAGDEKTPRTGANGASCRVRVCSPTLGHFTSSASKSTIFTPLGSHPGV